MPKFCRGGRWWGGGQDIVLLKLYTWLKYKVDHMPLLYMQKSALYYMTSINPDSYMRTETDFGRTSWVTLKSSQNFPNLERAGIPEKVIIILTWSSYLFYISPQQPNFFSATVQLLIHEALISSLFNFVLNRLTGMITTRAVALRSHATPVCYNKGASCD